MPCWYHDSGLIICPWTWRTRRELCPWPKRREGSSVLLDREIKNTPLPYSKQETGQKSHSVSSELEINNSVLC